MAIVAERAVPALGRATKVSVLLPEPYPPPTTFSHEASLDVAWKIQSAAAVIATEPISPPPAKPVTAEEANVATHGGGFVRL